MRWIRVNEPTVAGFRVTHSGIVSRHAGLRIGSRKRDGYLLMGARGMAGLCIFNVTGEPEGNETSDPG
ncbi:hypothetical protein DPEC_G00194400 [Dallia pectoralis]|uniref:Uncharacterized protein n=1 Tax=Dallia pectoralis TaxID=75939 RepID=A0ACC2G736_DALPE|nr:hypothetical protein DPEC_G00194400 [Dallia pectoralis]